MSLSVGDMSGETSHLVQAFATLQALGAGTELTAKVSRLEHGLKHKHREDVEGVAAEEGVTPALLAGALIVKSLAGQINVVIHAAGVLASLPYILEDGERILSLSLGAGNTGRAHDLETDRRIAEFKFIEWRGGPESIRQNGLFVDLFNLATAETVKRRQLYVVDDKWPRRFFSNRRALSSVLSKDITTAQRFRGLYGERFSTVRDYYDNVCDLVEIIDLRAIVPAFHGTNKPRA